LTLGADFEGRASASLAKVFWRKKSRNEGNAAVAEPEAPLDEVRTPVEPEFSGSTDELYQEISRLTEENRIGRDADREYRLLRLRHLAGMRMIKEERPEPSYPDPSAVSLPEAAGLPEFTPADVTPEVLHAGILRDGSVLIRGMAARDDALRLADEIERAFQVRDESEAGGTGDPGYYREFELDPFFGGPLSRPWIQEGGGLLAADSPKIAFAMLELFDSIGLTRLVRNYLGEDVAISTQKTTLRKATPDVPGAWHQDGAFMGPVRALNVWMSLSRCGDLSPGLDIVPRRLDDYVKAGTEGTYLDYQVSNEVAAEAAGSETPIIRPIFEPGDVLLFDEKCLHQTASDPSMPNPRYAIESWFFGGSKFPGAYGPIAA
jgi:hypothetical protein